MCKVKRNLILAGQLWLWIILLPVGKNVVIPLANAQENCEMALLNAQKKYEAGRLNEAITLLNRCLPEGLPKNERVSAYRLLALTHLAQDDLDKARKAVTNLLTLNRTYQYDPAKDPPRLKDLIDEILPSIPVPVHVKLFGGIKKWLWIGGGIAGTAVAVATLGKKPVDPDLPVPPDLPPDQP